MTEECVSRNPGEDEKELRTAVRQGLERLSPSLTNPHWLVLKKRREIFQRWIANIPGSQLCVLDIGGRIQPYRPLLGDRIKAYVAVDLSRTPLVSVLARGEELPFKNEQFDLVVCTQMLQYVPSPANLIHEVFRVVKPQGHLLLSIPGAYPIDSAEECWRYLPAGLHHLLARFAQVKIEAEGGSISGFFRTANACLNIFAKYEWLRSILRYTAYPVLNLTGALLEKLSGSSNEQFAVNYSVLAKK
jgi:SAM-dependent methyltransferase